MFFLLFLPECETYTQLLKILLATILIYTQPKFKLIVRVLKLKTYINLTQSVFLDGSVKSVNTAYCYFITRLDILVD